MKITRTQLKRIIRETIEEVDPRVDIMQSSAIVPMDEMINILLTHPDLNISFAKPGNEFSSEKEGGIWMIGEDPGETLSNGERIYDYYSEDYDTYDIGVHVDFMEFLDQRGWYAEWSDAGTIFLFPDQH